MWDLLRIVCPIQFVAAAVVAWKLRRFRTCVLVCMLAVPVTCSLGLLCFLELLYSGETSGYNYNGLMVALAFIPGLLAAALGGLVGWKAKKLRRR